MTGFIAAIVEAYGELRVNKARVLLSLFGVAVSVFAMTGVLGAGGMLSSALQQAIERDMGRPTVLALQPTGSVETTGAAARRDDAVLETLDRLGMTQRSRTAQFSLRVQTPDGVWPVQVNAVDPDYAHMYRIRTASGRWIAPSDQERLAPALVVDDETYERLGRPPLGSATVTSYGSAPTDPAAQGPTASRSVELVIVGVLPPRPGESRDGALTAFVPSGALAQIPGGDEAVRQRSYLTWVPPEVQDGAMRQLRRQLEAVPGGTIEVYSMGMSPEDLGFDRVTWAIAGVAGVVLLLGALGLVNISLVTVRHRLREIGIRRSYGATGPRIFVGVLMESVVATTVAGLIGVTAAVAVVRAPFVQRWFADIGLVDLPPFPVSAVLIGLLAAIAVGALAGILPAAIATRIKVIDAIRA